MLLMLAQLLSLLLVATGSNALTNGVPSIAKSIQFQLQLQSRERIDNPSDPIARTILLVPPDKLSERVKYLQKATNTRIEGLSVLHQACDSFDSNFQSEFGVKSAITRVSLIDPHKIIVRWNVTWVPVSALWLEVLGNAWPGVNVVPTTYNHLSNQPCTFSWNAVGKVFLDAMASGKLRIPLACIEGTSELIFSEDDDMLVSITEELSYAQDLQRGCLLNRRCSDDLRLFLETGRRSSALEDTWDDLIAEALPWASVPGSGSLDVTPTADGEEDGPIVFLGVAALLLVGFTNFAGPHLIGPSFFGSTHDIVERNIFDSVF
ncbi:hypothetical protein MHU86_8074 [Fragilaria crotonensis]|nr:hypothetical protein MHU86_8074 [Fragilaria crotonensis]